MRISDWSSDVCSSDLGRVGAQFWSVYVPSNPDEPQAVQQTIEQIDVMKRLVARYPDDLMLASTSAELEKAIKAGKIAGTLGMEGGHSIRSSLAVVVSGERPLWEEVVSTCNHGGCPWFYK